MRRHFRAQAAPAAALALAASLWALLGAPTAADNSRWGAGYFPNVTLTTQDGKPVRFYDDLIKGKIVAIDLIYTTCKYACPLETARLAQVQALLGDRMGKDVFFYSITIDPEHDTPPVLKEYAEKFHAGPGWTFLTGKASDIELISRKLGLYTEPDAANKDGHTPALLVGNEETGQWMRNSALDNPKFLARTIGDWLNSWKTARRGVSFAEAPATLNLDPGRYGFTSHCAPCHSIGGGQKVGPDLAGVTSARDRDWLSRFIASPSRLIEAGDPAAIALAEKYKPLQMPSLALAAADIDAIIRYIDDESSKVQPAARSAAQAVTATALAAVPAGSGPTITAAELTALLPPYLRIQEALAGDTLAPVAGSARSMASNIPRVDSPAEFILAPVLALERAGDLASARLAFGKLSAAMLDAARTIGMTWDGEVKLAYCPMARKYWLQNGEEIRNPYYGKEMLDCGRIVKE